MAPGGDRWQVDLTSGGVRLREFAPRDRAAFVALAGDDAVFEHMKFRYEDAADASARFDWFVDPDRQRQPRQLFFLVVATVPGDDFAGDAGVGPRGVDGERGEFGWYLASGFWNRGLAQAPLP